MATSNEADGKQTPDNTKRALSWQQSAAPTGADTALLPYELVLSPGAAPAGCDENEKGGGNARI
jgi:hypothetical protein